MTGLDPEIHVILEIATVITDVDLNIVAESPSLIVHQPESELAKMDKWNVEHHTQSGLLDAVRESEISLAEAEAVTFDLISSQIARGKSPLCGNTIWQDRRFLKVYMPTTEAYLHYRCIDVSTLKELARIWQPDLVPTKKNTHRALDDVHESIAELKHYRGQLFS